jgi:hypothetical protein
MNVDWVIPCRYVEVHDNLGSMIGAGIDTFWVPELPATLQVLCAVRLTATAEELTEGITHQMRNVVTDPSGVVVSDVGGEFEVGTENPRREFLNGIVLPSAITFEAEVAGSYQLEHIVDNDSKSIPLHVVVGQPDEDDE